MFVVVKIRTASGADKNFCCRICDYDICNTCSEKNSKAFENARDTYFEKLKMKQNTNDKSSTETATTISYNYHLPESYLSCTSSCSFLLQIPNEFVEKTKDLYTVNMHLKLSKLPAPGTSASLIRFVPPTFSKSRRRNRCSLAIDEFGEIICPIGDIPLLGNTSTRSSKDNKNNMGEEYSCRTHGIL